MTISVGAGANGCAPTVSLRVMQALRALLRPICSPVLLFCLLGVGASNYYVDSIGTISVEERQ
jgi:hypothetical protein